MKRRDLLKNGSLLSGGLILPGAAPALIASDRLRPMMRQNVMSGDVADDRAMIWGSVDRPARMVVEWSDNPAFRNVHRVVGPLATPATGLTAKVDLGGLPRDRSVHYRVAFHDPDDVRRSSDWTVGRLGTAPSSERSVRFTFAGDEAGQGFGINPEFGGYRIYEAMRQKAPDFFIHQGDQIYADGPLKPELPLAGGGVWRNVVTEAKSRIAETLDDFRGAYAYNLLDENKRRFLAEVPMHVQWDDHEVRNNWFPTKQLEAGGPDMAALIGNARQALLEYNPIRLGPNAPAVYRSFSHGSLLDVFLLDARSARTANQDGGGAHLFGQRQIDWLKAGLMRSRATWKLIATDIPLSLTVPDLNRDMPKGSIEGLADGRMGEPGGREDELATLLSFLRQHRIRNTVWISADVHYSAAIHYEPSRARFTDFDPFWEFVAGPINAGTGVLSGNPLDGTFGPEVVFKGVPDVVPDQSPRAGLQFFGMGEVDRETRTLTISIHDLTGKELFRQELQAM